MLKSYLFADCKINILISQRKEIQHFLRRTNLKNADFHHSFHPFFSCFDICILQNVTLLHAFSSMIVVFRSLKSVHLGFIMINETIFLPV